MDDFGVDVRDGGLDYFGVDEALKPLAKKAGQYGRVYGSGIRDGRGYGPYGAGYLMKSDRALPYGPNGELLSADYDLQGSALNWKPPKKVLPGFSSTTIGFEAMDLAKMGTGLLSGFGGMLSGGGGGGAQTQNAQAAAAERQRLEDEKRKAEQSANNMKIALGVGGALAAMGLFIVTRK